MEHLLTTDALLAFVSLTLLEIVLGIDNIVFLSILTSRLPKEQQPSARSIGLSLAMLTRIMLLLSLSWIMSFTKPLFILFSHSVSLRDIILVAGGCFLLAKSTLEIHQSLEGYEETGEIAAKKASFLSTVIQIAILDIIFSLDSVITAVGMAKHVEIMVAAIVAAIAVMLFLAGAIGEFIERHPTIKMLALSFLILVGVALIGEGLSFHIPKGYIYFAMFFSMSVEMLNMRLLTRRKQALKLHQRG